ncbi:MAG TPA: helix-turn-helix transcriptional regulator [Bacteroidia bacterium]|nr:helix-turn-helix transcriptional regulator [Bacteroidia bacterium]
MYNSLNINEKIIDFLRRSNVSQAELATRMGYNHSSLNRTLNSDDIKLSTFLEICDALNVSPIVFFDDSEHITKSEHEKCKEIISDLEDKVKALQSSDELIYLSEVYDIFKNELKGTPKDIQTKVINEFREPIRYLDILKKKVLLKVSQVGRDEILETMKKKIEKFSKTKAK